MQGGSRVVHLDMLTPEGKRKGGGEGESSILRATPHRSQGL
jgi:hypothetical protein